MPLTPKDQRWPKLKTRPAVRRRLFWRLLLPGPFANWEYKYSAWMMRMPMP